MYCCSPTLVLVRTPPPLLPPRAHGGAAVWPCCALSSYEQVFFNLDCLPARVKACVTHLADEAEDAVSEALQPAALAEATSSSSSAADAAGAGAAGSGGGGAGGEQRSSSPTRGGGSGDSTV